MKLPLAAWLRVSVLIGILLILGSGLLPLASDTALAAGESAPRSAVNGPIPVGALARIGKGAVSTVLLSPDERRLAVSTPLGVYMYDAATMRQIWYFRQFGSVSYFGGPASPLAFSNDGTRMLGIVNYQVTMWSVETGAILKTFYIEQEHNIGFMSVAFSGDDRYVIASPGYGPMVWETATGKFLFADFEIGLLDLWPIVATSPDGRLMAVGDVYGYLVVVYDLAAGERTHIYRTDFINRAYGQSGGVTALQFSPDSQYLSAGIALGWLATWRVPTDEWLYSVQVPGGAVSSIDFAADGSQIASGTAQINVIDAISGQTLRSLPGLPGTTYKPYFSVKGGLRSIALEPDMIGLWDADTSTRKSSLYGHDPAITTGLISADGTTLVLGRTTGEIEFLNRAARTDQFSLWAASAPVDLVLSPDGKTLSGLTWSLSNNPESPGPVASTVTTWDVATRQPLYMLGNHRAVVGNFLITPDGSALLLGLHNGIVTRHDLRTGQTLSTLDTYVDQASQITFAGSGQKIAIWRADDVVIWDVPTSSPAASVPASGSNGYSWYFKKALSFDGRLMARPMTNRGDDMWIEVWDTTTSQRIREYNMGPHWLASMAFSKDARLLVTGTTEGQIQVWNLQTGALLQTLRGHGASVTTLGFDPNGGLISASADGTVVYWPAY